MPPKGGTIRVAYKEQKTKKKIEQKKQTQEERKNKEEAAKKKKQQKKQEEDQDSSSSAPEPEPEVVHVEVYQPPRSPTPPQPESEEAAAEPLPTTEADIPTLKRKRKPPVTFTEDIELRVKEFLLNHSFIYIKGDKEYRNIQRKNRLWDDFAIELGIENVTSLKTWYDSVRTKVGKILEKKSGSASKTLTDRDKFLKTHFAFLGEHIARKKGRAPAQLSLRLGASTSSSPPPPHHSDDSDADDADADDASHYSDASIPQAELQQQSKDSTASSSGGCM